MRKGRAKEIHGTAEIAVPAWEEERLPVADPNAPYQMASGQKFYINLSDFVYEKRKDPATFVSATHFDFQFLHGICLGIYAQTQTTHPRSALWST
jgi:hypothetical protein